jgi:predicted RNA-binding Zn-ribbon protein involved in translation (DUF1610 family)
MALIDCPQCGHKVMSVASTCPKCGYSLTEQRKRESHAMRVAICRHCNREIAATSKLCPHCGEAEPVSRPPKWLVPAILAAVLLTVVFVISRGGSEEPVRVSEPVAATETVPTAGDTTPTPPPGAAEVSDPPQVLVPATPQTLTRWTTDWANMREDRDRNSDVVDILGPGAQIEVADLENRWWAVYVDGRRVGYISASLVANEPPTVEPDTSRQRAR